MSAFIETILQKLLTPDNDMIKHVIFDIPWHFLVKTRLFIIK
jgi:hypothetical protein